MFLQFNKRKSYISAFVVFSFILSESLIPAYAQQKKKRGSIIIIDVSSDSKEGAKYYRFIRERTKNNPQFEYKDIEIFLDPQAEEANVKTLSSAQNMFNRGYSKFAEGAYADASKDFEEAVALIEKVMVNSDARLLLIDSIVYHGMSLFLSGKKSPAGESFRKSVIIQPKVEYQVSSFPSDASAFYQKVFDEVKDTALGSIEIKTNPAYAEVFIDSVYLGVSPVPAEGYPVGEHFCMLRKSGYVPWIGKVQISAESYSDITIELKEAKKKMIFDDIIKKARTEISNRGSLKEILSDIRGFFLTDYALIINTEKSGSNVRTNLQLYDLVAKNLIQNISSPENGYEAPLDKNGIISLTNHLFEMEQQRMTTLETKVTVETEVVRSSGSILSRWWFWTAVAVVAGTGAGIGIYFATNKTASHGFPHEDGKGAVVLKF
jgi:tetratricopeptide (TPR) repeat protein